MPPLNAAQLLTLINSWWTPAAPANCPDFCIVVDVGQGNLNVVCNAHGQPFIYYDMGGGMLGSQFTYPEPEAVLCTQANPKFILSHWDVDHLRKANLLIDAGGLSGTTWLAPEQTPISKWAKAVRAKLQTGGRTLNVWPNTGVANRSASHFQLFKLNGSDINNDGLALRIENPSVANEYILMVGDAGYETDTFGHAIHGCDLRCVGLVSSHHGAEVDHWASLPRPQQQAGGGAPTSRVVAFSFGAGNFYGHPSTTGVDAYVERHWHDDFRLDTAGSEADAAAAGPRGNLGMVWPDTQGPGWVRPGARALDVQQAAVAIIASAVAELDLYLPGVAGAEALAVAAAHQAALEVATVDSVDDEVAKAMRNDGDLGEAVMSTNGGITWNGINRGLGRSRVNGLAIGAAAAYAATANGLFQSTNQGTQWNPVANAGAAPILAVAAHPTNAGAQLIGRPNGLWATSNAGVNWVRWAQLPESPVLSAAFDPGANHIYAGTRGGLFRSDDGGTTFLPQFGTVAVTALSVFRGDEHRVLAATSGGLFGSSDGGQSWTAYTALLGQAVRAVAFDPINADHIYIGTNAGLRESYDGGASWTAALAASGMIQVLLVNPSDGDDLWCGTSAGLFRRQHGIATQPLSISITAISMDLGGNLYVGTAANSICRSLGGAVFSQVAVGGRLDAGIQALALAPTGHANQVAVVGGVACASTDSGANWSPINLGVTILAMAFAPSNASKLYWAARGRLFVSADAGASWTVRNGPGIPIQSIAIDRNTPTNVAFATPVGLWSSNDRGAGAVPNPTLGAVDVQAVAIDATNGNNHAVGTGAGLSLSSDGGATWTTHAALGSLDVRAVLWSGTAAWVGGSAGQNHRLVHVANAMSPVPAGRLLNALTNVGVGASTASHALTRDLAATVADAVLRGGARAARDLTQEAYSIHDALDGRPIGEQAPLVVNNILVMLGGHVNASNGQTVAANAGVEARTACVPVVTAAQNKDGANVPTAANLEALVSRAIVASMWSSVGRPGSRRGAAQVAAKTPPLVAAAIAVDATVQGSFVRRDAKAAIVATAALLPLAPINPEAAPPTTAIVPSQNALRLCRVAGVAAMQVATLPLDEAAKGATAAARVALACALGAPQVGCHRHPRSCGANVCSLAIHSHVRNRP